jgi:hypothetical protein
MEGVKGKEMTVSKRNLHTMFTAASFRIPKIWIEGSQQPLPG